MAILPIRVEQFAARIFGLLKEHSLVPPQDD